MATSKKINNEGKPWSEEDIQLLRKLYPTTKNVLLRLTFGRSVKAIASRAKLLKIQKLDRYMSPWNEEMIATLKKLYANTTNEEIGKQVGMTPGAVAAKAYKLGLKKTKEFMREWALKTAFKPGSVPVNKGKKQTEFMSPEGIERTKATRFKKGEVALHKQHFKNGDITIRHDTLKDGSVRSYKWIRISQAKWKMLHVFNWEKANGPVPEGHIIVFKNKFNTMDCEVEHLECITIADNMRRNTIHRYPLELKQTIRLVHKLDKKIKSKNDGKEYKHN